MTHPEQPDDTRRIDRPIEEPVRAYPDEQGGSTAALPETPVAGDPAPPADPRAGAPQSAGDRSSRRPLVLVGVIALLVGGLIGGGIAWAAAPDDHHDRVRPTAMDSHFGGPPMAEGKHGKAGKHGKNRAARGAVGQISAITGDTWTIKARSGETLTVDITDQTAFGTARKPQQRSEFAVGDRIVVLGKREGTTVMAMRVVKRTPKPTAPAGQAPPSTPTQPS
ncbi:DUF5666 domain-containing protein [Williamsia sp. CHRR-6]|uniref:DUF5666 domain-containing protein n=1 Tax=Williamsia sp. CHRR-6 TaxID=2835871 RepID=UPI001BDB5DBD|nr:DUF5666 domain-containing protein [Williamsia sp. CHRR-6]MBT0567086.1 hypothetical protein [Williamsia sp. CHRR-6]